LGATEGEGGIPVEMINSLGEKVTETLVQICQQIYISEEWPVDFMQSVLVPLPKKQLLRSAVAIVQSA
jgi:hypothetical protein